MKEMLLVDGNSLFFKAFYGTYFRLKQGAERTPDDEPINALRLFSLMMINLKNQFNPEYMLVAFDERNTQTYRHQYDFYKAGRKQQPDDLYIQMPMVKEFLELYGIKQLSNVNYEADDIIGILSTYGNISGFHVDVVSGDKDLLQLVDDNVDVYMSKTGVSEMEKYTMSNFPVKMQGLMPYHVIEYKSIAGDNSDNIEGIRGVGPKTAVTLLTEYDSLDTILNNVDNLKPGLQKKFTENKSTGLLSHKLATIMTDTDIPINPEDFKVKTPDYDALFDFLDKKTLYNVISKLKK